MKGQRSEHKSKWSIIWVIEDDGSRKPFVLDSKGSLALQYWERPKRRCIFNEIQKIVPLKKPHPIGPIRFHDFYYPPKSS